ncbi:hypothetical protein BE04_20535 [Sorangium cellulosum]|uniref:HNH nuclease domain-containing protein n=1 Tax=Sorangium cellulosum TaxID=56 RepID=A0A150PJB5_SORCE|nr:hypothetical protein BE04_20535 [Sorangium cellulosum]
MLYGSYDVVVNTPVPIDEPRHSDGKSFGPRVTTCGDRSAKNLLADLIVKNPAQADDLLAVAEQVGWRIPGHRRRRIFVAGSSTVNHEQRAALAWDALVAQARTGRATTYGALAPKIGVHHRALRYPLGLIQDYCLEARLPPLTSIVVYAQTGTPGEGFTAWDVDDLPSGQRAVYAMDWQRLQNPFSYAESGQTSARLADTLFDDPGSAASVYQLVKSRGSAQVIFRMALLRAYQWACAFCGFTYEEALDGAHIHPWSKCAVEHRMDVRNGLLLCSNHHRMFDAGWLTVTPDYRIEYGDTALAEGPYSDIDKLVGPDLHGTRLRLPGRRELWPNPDLLRTRIPDE